MTIDPNNFIQICKGGQESRLTKTYNYALLKPFDHQAVGSIETFVVKNLQNIKKFLIIIQICLFLKYTFTVKLINIYKIHIKAV